LVLFSVRFARVAPEKSTAWVLALPFSVTVPEDVRVPAVYETFPATERDELPNTSEPAVRVNAPPTAIELWAVTVDEVLRVSPPETVTASASVTVPDPENERLGKVLVAVRTVTPVVELRLRTPVPLTAVAPVSVTLPPTLAVKLERARVPAETTRLPERFVVAPKV
jgi:hypothetical protein